MEFFTLMAANWVDWGDVALRVVGGFSIAAAATKNTSDDAIVQHIYNVVNFLGGNIGRAKNAG